MSIFKDLKSFEFSTNKEHAFGVKSGIVWGNSNKSNCVYPLLYISKPKGISEEDYNELLDSLEIAFIKKER